MINWLRILNFHEVIRKSARCIKKNRRDVNMKKISSPLPYRRENFLLLAKEFDY